VASELLVESEIRAGLTLVQALDEADFGVSAAFWLYHGELGKWKMVIGYSGQKSALQQKYLEAATISARWRDAHPDRPILELSRVKITHQDDKLIRGLHSAIHVEGLGEVRFSRNVVNGIYVEDAIIHRLAA